MYDIVKAREKVFLPLWSRMDADLEMIEDYRYILRDFKAKGYKEIGKAYSVTRPLPQNDYNKYTNKLIALERKIKVSSDDPEFDEGKIIQFCKDSDFAVNARLTQKPGHSTRATHNAHICHRGWVAEMELWRYEDGKLVADSRPIDPRWLVWDTDGENLDWACVVWYRYPNDINGEYDTDFTGDSLLEVRDVYTKDKNIVYVTEQEVFKQDNPYGYVPFVIQPAPFGPIHSGRGALEYMGESVFYPQRHTYDEANFAASISKTMAREGLRPPLQTKGKGPKEYAGSGDIVEEQEEPLTLVPRQDMTNAQRNQQGMADGDLQRSAWSRTSFGSVSAPMSGDALDILGTSSAEVLNSRIQGLKLFEANVYRMRIDQFNQINKKLKVGRSRQHKPSDLNGEYDITVHYVDNSIESWARRGAAMAANMGLFPKRFLVNEIGLADDPDKLDRELDIEETERQVPIVFQIDRTFDLIDANTEESNEKAWAMALQVIATLRQMTGGQPQEPVDKAGAKPIVNMRTRETANAEG